MSVSFLGRAKGAFQFLEDVNWHTLRSKFAEKHIPPCVNIASCFCDRENKLSTPFVHSARLFWSGSSIRQQHMSF